MRRSVVLVSLFAVGCGFGLNPNTGPKLDTAAARQYVRSCFSPAITVEMTVDDEPEYADVPKIPRERLAKSVPDRPAACAVRVRVTYRDENRTTHDDWLVWVSSDHKAVGWSSNVKGDNWREQVRSLATK
jgi:hypothetical protein